MAKKCDFLPEALSSSINVKEAVGILLVKFMKQKLREAD